MKAAQLAVRWTIGDVSSEGWDALGLSIWGAWHTFGPDAEYVVCVNSVPLQRARELAGCVPDAVCFRDVTADLWPFIAAHLDRGMAEGVGWKFAPLSLFPDRYELALDNDCILWSVPRAIATWLCDMPSTDTCVIAEDAQAAFGQFASLCGTAPRNSGIRGVPPGIDWGATLREVLQARPATLVSELDEQGLQVAAAGWRRPPLVVKLDEVAICSPFPPHKQALGSCGAHFVGLNARELPWDYYGRPASECTRENWLRHRAEIVRLAGAADG